MKFSHTRIGNNRSDDTLISRLLSNGEQLLLAINVNADLTIIPISKVTYGFASGGSDFPSKNNVELFGGGGGAGITINPVAFLVCNKGEVTIKHITASDNAAERAVNLIPEMFDKVTNFVERKKTAATEEPAVPTFVETE